MADLSEVASVLHRFDSGLHGVVGAGGVARQTDGLIFPSNSGLFFCPFGTKAQFKAEGTKTHPMSLPRPIPGSAMLRNH
jgi:hypothetical protein